MKKNIFLSSFYFLFIVALVYTFYSQLKYGFPKESWQTTEWLINYQGGFVRRGLAGEIILMLYTTFGLSTDNVIMYFCLIAYLLLISFFIYSFRKNKFPLILLSFVFFLGEPVINNYWVRKDVLLMLIFISLIYFSTKKSNIYLVLINLIFVIGLLIHESIGFFGFPILLLLLSSTANAEKSFSKSLFVSSIKLSPALLTFLLCLYYKGSLSISEAIWKSWSKVPFKIQSADTTTIPAAIDGLSWSFEKALSYTKNTFTNFNDGIYAPIALFFILVLIFYYLTNVISSDKEKSFMYKQNISTILLFQFLTIVPLSIIGWDYSRWTFFWVTSSFVIFILVPNERLVNLFPKIFSSMSLKITTFLDAIFIQVQGLVYIIPLVIGVPICSWSFDYYFQSTPIVIVLRFISTLIHQLFILIGINLS